MKKAIVTGATGFIGGYLIDELIKNNVEVIAIVKMDDPNIGKLNKKIRVIFCDLENISTLDSLISDLDVDVFYHLAWAGTAGVNRSNYEMQLLNIKYTCDAAIISKKINVKRFLTTGTVTENIAKNYLSNGAKSENLIYGIAKHTAHTILNVVAHKYKIDYVWAQLSNIYGGKNTSGNIISYTLSELASGRKPLFSKAEQPYDLMYVGDVTRALFLLGCKQNIKNKYFIGSGTPRILKEYLLAIKFIFGKNSDIGLGERPDDGAIYNLDWFDTSDLISDIDFKVENSFEDNISKIIYDMKSNEVTHD